jgi:hypothetical protein
VTVNFAPDRALPKANPGDQQRYVIDAFITDNHYRNQFETKTTGGNPSAVPGGWRDNAERELFDGGYHHHALDGFERPRYGSLSLNREQNPQGAVSQYGDCYFLLKNSIKERVTLSPGASKKADHVGTIRNFEHVLLATTDDADVAALMNTALGRKGDKYYLYFEAQVHGPLELDKDVEAMAVDVEYRGTPYEAQLRQLAAKWGFVMKWRGAGGTLSDDVPPPPGSGPTPPPRPPS